MTSTQDVGFSIGGLRFVNLKFRAKGHRSPYHWRCEVRSVQGVLEGQCEGLVDMTCSIRHDHASNRAVIAWSGYAGRKSLLKVADSLASRAAWGPLWRLTTAVERAAVLSCAGAGSDFQDMRGVHRGHVIQYRCCTHR